jgi:beta-mannosidase
MKIAVEHFRSQMPRIMGALYWQINDCWPVASWSGTDYYGTWKALHYYAKRFYNPVLVAPIDDGKMLKIYGISDLDLPVDAELYVGLFTYGGKMIQEGKSDVRLEPRTSSVLLSKSLEELKHNLPPEEVYLYCELRRGKAKLSSNLFHFCALKRVSLPEPEIKTDVTERDGKPVVRLETNLLAKNVYLSVPGLKGRFDDNFFDLVPGRVYEVAFISDQPADITQFRQTLKVTSLRDSY